MASVRGNGHERQLGGGAPQQQANPAPETGRLGRSLDVSKFKAASGHRAFCPNLKLRINFPVVLIPRADPNEQF
jgi:hypothetical protein